MAIALGVSAMKYFPIAEMWTIRGPLGDREAIADVRVGELLPRARIGARRLLV
jgi:hypothetical protein